MGCAVRDALACLACVHGERMWHGISAHGWQSPISVNASCYRSTSGGHDHVILHNSMYLCYMP